MILIEYSRSIYRSTTTIKNLCDIRHRINCDNPPASRHECMLTVIMCALIVRHMLCLSSALQRISYLPTLQRIYNYRSQYVYSCQSQYVCQYNIRVKTIYIICSDDSIYHGIKTTRELLCWYVSYGVYDTRTVHRYVSDMYNMCHNICIFIVPTRMLFWCCNIYTYIYTALIYVLPW